MATEIRGVQGRGQVTSCLYPLAMPQFCLKQLLFLLVCRVWGYFERGVTYYYFEGCVVFALNQGLLV